MTIGEGEHGLTEEEAEAHSVWFLVEMARVFREAAAEMRLYGPGVVLAFETAHPHVEEQRQRRVYGW